MALRFSELSIGMIARKHVEISVERVRSFIELTNDVAPVHTDAGHARSMGYDRPIAHGLLVGSMYSQLLGCELPGPLTVVLRLSLAMIKPVLVGDMLHYHVVISGLSEAAQSVTLNLAADNARGERVSTGTAVCVYRHNGTGLS